MQREKHPEHAERPENGAVITSIPNFRDVGQTINHFAGQRLLKEGFLYRSAAANHASPTDRKRLNKELGVQTILDLRIPSERRAAGQQLAGMNYQYVDLIGRDTKNYLLRQLGWVSWFHFCLLYYVLGNHMAAKRVLSRELLQKRGMDGFLIDVLDHGKAQILEALMALTNPSPTLIHCVHGKDRTGLLCIVVLLAADVSPEAIAYDYHLSDEDLSAQYKDRKKYMDAHGLDETFAITCPGLVENVDRHIRAKYGGIDGYLDSINFGRGERQKLRHNLSA